MLALEVMTEEEIPIFWSTHTPSEHSQHKQTTCTHIQKYSKTIIFFYFVLIIINYQLAGDWINGMLIKIKMKPLKMT